EREGFLFCTNLSIIRTHMGVMVHLSTEYLRIKRKKNNRFFIHSTIASKPETFHSKINIPIG
ncbi:MAG: hypothetical protein ACOVSR_10340, partial [Bacteroidia bacterium]